ncbi:XRE family transcriptional regulator, partial [Leuconostoc falkenbergense]|uniref:XRE family transcriptional regulator n=1 Tax=Leuconostoc falkenbergense TaxID=2766470 RepID=UPI0039E91155
IDNVINEYHDAADNSKRSINTEYNTIKNLESEDLTNYLCDLGIHQTSVVLTDFIVQAQYEGELCDKIDTIQDVSRELVFDKLDYYTADEMNLFINLISISQNFNYIYGVYLDYERLFSRQDFNAMYRNKSESIQQLLMIRFNMIGLCMQHDAKNLAKKIIRLTQQLKDVVDDMYSVLLLRLTEVVGLIIAQEDAQAEILYNEIFSAMSFFLPATGQFRFEMLFLDSFEAFKKSFE